MKKFKKILTMLMAVAMLFSLSFPAFAAPTEEATINTAADCSIELYKYDLTNARKDGVWDGSYVSTGVADADFQSAMGEVKRTGSMDVSNPLHNGGIANGYAIKGVEYSYLKVADIVTFTESANDQHPGYNLTQVLYGFDKNKSADMLAAIGLGNGTGSYANAAATPKLNGEKYWYYQSDVLNAALAESLAANSTAVKNSLEKYITDNISNDESTGGKMPLTDENGWTGADHLKVGLYLLVETEVPEMVTSTTSPFFLSLPMTSVDGTNAEDGGHRWIYDVVLYPKNETGIVSLEKTVREAQSSTGKNNASAEITDGFAHNATGSTGDTMEYQIVSTLPSITSEATYLSEYTFHDALADGLTYSRDGVQIEWFTDADCRNKVTGWNESDNKFTVEYDDQEMTIRMTADGLAEINGTAENANGALYSGYSNYTMRITYTAAVDSDRSFIFGDEGNENTVSLTWRRTSSDYYDMLWDDCHVYSYGLDLLKKFTEKKDAQITEINAAEATESGMFDHVKFTLRNNSDSYWVVAEYNEAEGIYYVTGRTDKEENATIFTPHTVYEGTEGEELGHMIVKGLEDDEYILTEIETADDFTLLKDDIHFEIKAEDDPARPCTVYDNEAKLGVYQNDGHYYFTGCPDLPLANIPQKQLAHNLLTASGTVDGNEITMKNDVAPADGTERASTNAIVPMTVLNTRGFDLPQTGEHTTLLLTAGGTVAVVAAAATMIFLIRRKKQSEQAD